MLFLLAKTIFKTHIFFSFFLLLLSSQHCWKPYLKEQVSETTEGFGMLFIVRLKNVLLITFFQKAIPPTVARVWKLLPIMCDETMMRYVFKKQTKNRQTLDLYAQVFGLADRSLIDNIWTLD